MSSIGWDSHEALLTNSPQHEFYPFAVIKDLLGELVEIYNVKQCHFKLGPQYLKSGRGHVGFLRGLVDPGWWVFEKSSYRLITKALLGRQPKYFSLFVLFCFIWFWIIMGLFGLVYRSIQNRVYITEYMNRNCCLVQSIWNKVYQTNNFFIFSQSI